MTQKKVIISYSWSSPKHKEWVKKLVSDLEQNGIEVIADFHNLKVGQDLVKFMERMVNDPSIDKVVIVSDKEYVEKSNNREGGVGAEANIIASKVLDQQDDVKFIALARELDETGKPCVPTFYGSRLYIDFTNDEQYSNKLNELVNCIIGEPHDETSRVRTQQADVEKSEEITTAITSTHYNEAINAISEGASNAYFLTRKYLNALNDCFEQFRLIEGFDPASDTFIENINSFLPYRKEFSEIVESIAINTKDTKYGDLLHGFFEKAQDFCYPPERMRSYRKFEFDNYMFFNHEMFLHAAATFIREDRPDLFNILVEQPYYSKQMKAFDGDGIASFTLFRNYLWSFEIRNRELNLNRTSIPADLIHDRSESETIFTSVRETDFILYLRSHLTSENRYDTWYPDTIAYIENDQIALEVFSRSRSLRYFEAKISPIFNNASVAEFKSLVKKISNNRELLPEIHYHPIDITKLTGHDYLGTLK